MKPSRHVPIDVESSKRAGVDRYEPPTIVAIGSVEHLTQGSSGTFGDGLTKRSKL